MEINGKNIVLKYGLRPMFIWEEMVGRPFEINTLMDTYCFFYACIVANPENPSLEFNEFINWCDETPNAINEFNDFIAKEMEKRSPEPKKKAVKPRKNSQ